MNLLYKILGIFLVSTAVFLILNVPAFTYEETDVSVYGMPRPSDKIEGLVKKEDGDNKPPIVIWCEYKALVTSTMATMRDNGYPLEKILGMLNKNYRESTFNIPHFIYIDYQRYARIIYRHRDRITVDNAEDWAYNECLMTGF